ncbi:hypothetical protein MSSAC_2038 [Methanosarcina siciliae C2J]|uniref:Uncharacterized protein n=1 Tax=Methanosarcina siciliae C2J TaxID=1434118 RepID=A0A0E3PPX2_9EURY|nr:hypothetical protein [Methanosarcina siciliae]AKB36628.1 hypothetical protein MSSAC_2038 [Methanosarcina siciliae C2J]
MTGSAAAGGYIGTVIAAIYTKSSKVANAVGVLVAWTIGTVYWSEKNADGSLDMDTLYKYSQGVIVSTI